MGNELSSLSSSRFHLLSFLSSPHSDGMSRTGVFITTMAEVERVKVQGEVDIFQTVKAARSERPHMVSTPVSRGVGRGGLWVGWRGRWSISHCKQRLCTMKSNYMALL